MKTTSKEFLSFVKLRFQRYLAKKDYIYSQWIQDGTPPKSGYKMGHPCLFGLWILEPILLGGFWIAKVRYTVHDHIYFSKKKNLERIILKYFNNCVKSENSEKNVKKVYVLFFLFKSINRLVHQNTSKYVQTNSMISMRTVKKVSCNSMHNFSYYVYSKWPRSDRHYHHHG